MSDYILYSVGLPTTHFLERLAYWIHIPTTTTWYVAWGTGGTLVAGDLTTAKTGMNEEVTRSLGTFSRTTNTMKVTVTFSPTGDQIGKTCDEIGVYDAATGGNLLFWGFPWLEPDGISGITIGVGDTMAFTIPWALATGSF